VALLFMDGFDAADGSTKWSTMGMGADATTRFGTGRSISGSGINTTTKLIPASAQVFLGYATRFTGNHSISAAFYGDGGSVAHIALYLNPGTGQLELRRGTNWSGGTLLATGPTAMVSGSWHFIEIAVTISDTVGTVEVRLDGLTTPEITFTGDTRNAGTSTNIDMLAFNCGGNIGLGGVGRGYLDDLYVCDATGITNNTFLGDARIYTLAPTGNGTDSGLTGSDGNQVNNYQLVNTVPFLGATYSGATAAGSRDTYQMADLPSGISTVFGVQNNLIASKTDANSSLIKNVLRVNGSLYYGSQVGLNATYQNYRKLYDLNPDSGTRWVVADVNTLESGMEVF
jgi:hypothetical protein